jgi:signal recognition particle subunit SRP54
MTGMLGGMGRGRKATKSPKIKRKGKKGKVKERRVRGGGGLPGGFPGGMPGGLPVPPAGGTAEPKDLPEGFEMPTIDFSKLGKGKKG